MVHKTHTMEQVKALRSQAKDKKAALQAAEKLRAFPEARDLQEEIREQMENAQAEAAALKSSGRARLEDLTVFEIQKTSKKGKTHSYWHASWMEGKKVINVYLGSCKKMGQEEALQKARRLKAQALGINQELPEEP